MIIFTKRYFMIIAFIIFLSVPASNGKRGGGGRRGGSSRSSGSIWGRTKQTAPANYDLYGSGQRKSKSSQQAPQPDAASNTHKASAPPSPSHETQKTSVGDSSSTFIQQEKKQQTPVHNEQKRPIGWDVNKDANSDGNINKNSAWNVGNSNPQSGAPVNPVHQPHASYPSNGAPPPYSQGSYPNGNTGFAHPPPQGAPPPYSPGSYPNGNTGFAHPPPQGAPPPYSPGTYPNGNTGLAYPTSNIGHQQHPYNTGRNPNYNYSTNYPQQHYNPNYPNTNFGAQPPPGYYQNTNRGGGLFSGLFGGNKHGYGGYGGFGGVGGYGKRYGGGFGSGFGKNAYRNAFFGLLVWNLISGLTRRPYYVYNYYNNPEKIPEEIPLPANAIVLCSDNVTSLCAPNTAPLCTTNGTILCVALAQQTVPCDDSSTMKCVNSTVTCTDDTEDGCNGTNTETKTSSVNIPCVTNATIIGKIVDNSTIAFSGSGILDTSSPLCVTTLAQPQPEEEAKLCASNSTCVENQDAKVDQNAAVVAPVPRNFTDGVAM